MLDVVGFKCGECGGEKFPEGMYIYLCPICGEKIHGGCWKSHSEKHMNTNPNCFNGVKYRRGIMGAYGVIRWFDVE